MRPLFVTASVLVLAGTLAVAAGIAVKAFTFLGLVLLVVALGTITFALLKYR